MKYSTRKSFLQFIIPLCLYAVIILITCCAPEACGHGEEKKYEAEVLRVIDGDTVIVCFPGEKPHSCNRQERVRLIGVDTPEMHFSDGLEPDYYAQEAKAYTSSCLEGKTVEISLDDVSSERDVYDRIIAYIYIDGECFNRRLIQEGFGYYYGNFEFNRSLMDSFSKAQDEAKERRIGLWSILAE